MKIGILFDLDGTLLDTLGDLQVAVNYALSQFGYPGREKWEIRSFLGNGMGNLIQRSLPEGVSEDRVDEALAIYRTYYESHNQILTAPYDGIYDALEELKAYPIGVVSNKQDTAVKPMCRHFFGDVYALGEVPGMPRKPAPYMVQKAMADLEIDGAIYVGDSEVDLQVAENAKLPCLLVTWGFRDREDLEAAGGKHFCHEPADLVQSIEDMINLYYCR